MYELMVEANFSAAHQLRNYQGKCESLHGHNWRVQVVVRAEGLNDIGLAIDFTELKRELKSLLAQLDHLCLNQLSMFCEDNPSSENIARWLYNELGQNPALADVKIHLVRVWESDAACAAYFE
jgi:6-pyruvoyltetrahydropterin/6-carboxytetrahydropterin synthase